MRETNLISRLYFQERYSFSGNLVIDITLVWGFLFLGIEEFIESALGEG